MKLVSTSGVAINLFLTVVINLKQTLVNVAFSFSS